MAMGTLVNQLEAFFENICVSNQNKSTPAVLEMANRGISLAYTLVTNSQNIQYINEHQTSNNPLDKIFLGLRKFSWVENLAEILYKIYKKLSLKAKIL